MTKRWLDALFSARPELRPARALLTPVWLGALAVLALNDHLFKGGGVLPGALTGKLSDLAGMIVAPVLLAALLGLRSRRGLALCTLAVGLVFSAINLSPACADAWSWLMGLVGFPWTITVDPTDLLALPALALGWRALVPAMLPPAPAAAPRLSRPRPLELGAATLGTLLCVATSSSEEGGDFSDEGPLDAGTTTTGLGSYEPIFADVYLHNSSNADQVVVRLRELREDVLVDCFNAESDPGILFSDVLFDEGVTWTLPPLTNVPARQIGMHPDRECYAVLVQSDTLGPTVLFWRASDLPPGDVEGQHLSPDNYAPGAVILGSDADGVVSITGSESDVVFPTSAPTPDAYLPQSDATRVAWSEPPLGLHQIAGLDLGDDGCAAFTFDDGSLPRFYLCTPLTTLPFEVGQFVLVDDFNDVVLLSRQQDPNDPTPVPELKLAASRGTSLPAITGATLAAKPDFPAHLGPDPVCGTVAQPQELSVSFGGDIDTLAVGESRTYDDGAHALTLYSVHAERRLILDPACAEGPDALGDDLEIVAVWTDSPQP